VEEYILYYRVAHAFVIVRSSPSVTAAALARKHRDEVVRCRRVGETGWVQLEESSVPSNIVTHFRTTPSYMLVDGAAVGLGVLLERVGYAQFSERLRLEEAERLEEKTKLDQAVNSAMERLKSEDPAVRKEVVKVVSAKFFAATVAKAHHAATRSIRGEDASIAQDERADTLVRDGKIADALDSKGIAVLDIGIDAEALRRECESLDQRKECVLSRLFKKQQVTADDSGDESNTGRPHMLALSETGTQASAFPRKKHHRLERRRARVSDDRLGSRDAARPGARPLRSRAALGHCAALATTPPHRW